MQGYLISVLGKAQMFFGRHFLMAAAGSKNVSQSDANNVLETAGEVTAEATEEVNRFIEFFHDNIPNLISFGANARIHKETFEKLHARYFCKIPV